MKGELFMTKKEMKQKVENMIVDQMNESGLTEEEVLEPVMVSLVYEFYYDQITLEDLMYGLDYLGYAYDAEVLIKDKEERKERLAERKARKEKKTSGKKQNQK